MKKLVVFLAALVAAVSASSVAQARSNYRDDVNAVCGTSYGCSFCHDNGNKQLYLDGGACAFCPDAPSCTPTPTPPPPSTPPPTGCTDGDGDGYFLEPGCAQLYDCNDQNSSIYPGAPEIGCDGIDQDCSGADRLKGKGCGHRKRR